MKMKTENRLKHMSLIEISSDIDTCDTEVKRLSKQVKTRNRTIKEERAEIVRLNRVIKAKDKSIALLEKGSL